MNGASLKISPAERKALAHRVWTNWGLFRPLFRLRMWFLRKLYKIVFWLLSSPKGLWLTRWLAAVLRRIHPVPKGFGVAVPLRADALRDALSRPGDFNGAEAMTLRLPAGEVVLGIDWERRHAEERARLEEALDAAPEVDAARIRRVVRKRCATALFAREDLNGVNLAEIFEDVALDVSEDYLGVGVFDASERDALREIIRSLASRVFQAPVFLSPEDLTAILSKDRMRSVAEACLARTEQDILDRPGLADEQMTVMRRLLHLARDASPGKPGWLNDDWVIRNMATLSVFGSVTSARAMTQAVPQMLRDPDRHNTGTIAAQYYAQAEAEFGALETDHFEPEPLKQARCNMRKVVFEALRWHPMLSMLGARTALRDTALAPGTDAMTGVKAGTKVLPLLLGAMHDGATFHDPGRFCPFDRRAEDYLHFGAGPHECVGRRMAEIQMEEIAYALLRHPFIHKKTIRCGKIRYDGPAVLELCIARM